jgi:hypothetical protein
MLPYTDSVDIIAATLAGTSRDGALVVTPGGRASTVILSLPHRAWRVQRLDISRECRRRYPICYPLSET